ncbi:DUF3823 domain-containing protein [Hymenobacter volaticus]|uniref:DUF3823 domain-containing protein n=1 Tax=Hymenobacter volaticus TaxID=2932254 RepID=A0ABY4GG60_9BACT|nr:DUF3823 domain-containing protein [Hymenobacter volaticus]UOQ69800.1 DUF3823 domain-containing protein [Hymenobacter volaticus]
MKAFLYSLLAGTALFMGCAKDNVEPPSSTLTGRIVYQDQVLGLRSNGSTDLGNQTTMLELWQRGYQLFTKIPVFVNQDGTFQAKLFDGNYKLVRSRGNGPWVDNTDSIDVQVRGNTVIDVPVTPYFTVTDAAFQRSGNTLTATCRVNRIVAGKDIDRVVLLISRTQFVDDSNALERTEKNAAAVNLSQVQNLSVTIPSSITGSVFARIGVKAAGVGQYVYSPVQKF